MLKYILVFNNFLKFWLITVLQIYEVNMNSIYVAKAVIYCVYFVGDFSAD